MGKTKRGLLLAGSIVAIVGAAWMLILCLFLSLFSFVYSETLILESYKSDPAYEVIEEIDGSIVIYDTETGDIVMNEDDIFYAVTVPKIIISVSTIYIFAMAITTLILSIIVLSNTIKRKTKKGPIIALIVFSVLLSDIVVAGLIIAGLCIKDMPKEDKEEDIIVEDPKETIAKTAKAIISEPEIEKTKTTTRKSTSTTAKTSTKEAIKAPRKTTSTASRKTTSTTRDRVEK